MEQRPTKKEIIDQMIEWATLGRFKGDKRDGQAPPIKVQNFTNEMIIRYAAKALRARLSRLPFAELWTEAIEAADYVRAQQEQILKGNELVDRLEREAAERVDRQQQSDRAKRSRRQPAILAAARHYRGRGMNAGEAWDAINNAPYATGDGNTVKIEGPKLRLEQRMRVISRDGRQPKRPIRFAHWLSSIGLLQVSLAKADIGDLPLSLAIIAAMTGPSLPSWARCAAPLQSEIFVGIVDGCELLRPTAEGRGIIHWVRINLTAPGIELYVTPLDSAAVRRGFEYRLRWIEHVAKDERLAVAINCTMFTSTPLWRPQLLGDLANGAEPVVWRLCPNNCA